MGDFKGFEVISIYTRKAAIEEGDLVDITELANQHGFLASTAITASIRSDYPDDKEIVWLLINFNFKVHSMQNRETSIIEVIDKMHRKVWLHIGPDDSGKVCFTMMRPEDY